MPSQRNAATKVNVFQCPYGTLATSRCPRGAGHVGLYPGFIDENQTLWVNLVLILFPPLTPTRDIGPVLLAGAQAFF